MNDQEKEDLISRIRALIIRAKIEEDVSETLVLGSEPGPEGRLASAMFGGTELNLHSSLTGELIVDDEDNAGFVFDFLSSEEPERYALLGIRVNLSERTAELWVGFEDEEEPTVLSRGEEVWKILARLLDDVETRPSEVP